MAPPRRPKYQNEFAYRHNPKSKKTKKILESPNEGLCRRCHDKIEWRKKYRKYKPLKRPKTCHGCGLRNVRAAYHTLCSSCASERKVCPFCGILWSEIYASEREHNSENKTKNIMQKV